jgi:hypothetical protein
MARPNRREIQWVKRGVLDPVTQSMRRDQEQQYLDISASEAARLLVALQNAVGNIMASDNRRSESEVRLWIHSPDTSEGGANVTVYKLED